MMRAVTLDTNCLLDLEDGTERAEAVRELIARHDAGAIVLSIPAIMASERQRGGTYLETFAQFEVRLHKLGVAHLPLIHPMGYWGIGFWDHMLWPDDTMVAIERQIHEVLHPDIQFEYEQYCRALGLQPSETVVERRWRNAKCDVQVVWSHIQHHGDVLVTNDTNFTKQSKLPRLVALGAGAIVKTDVAPAFLDRAP